MDGHDGLDAPVAGRSRPPASGSPPRRERVDDGQRLRSATGRRCRGDGRLGSVSRQDHASMSRTGQESDGSGAPLTARVARHREWNGHHKDCHKARRGGHASSDPRPCRCRNCSACTVTRRNAVEYCLDRARACDRPRACGEPDPTMPTHCANGCSTPSRHVAGRLHLPHVLAASRGASESGPCSGGSRRRPPHPCSGQWPH